MPSPRVHCGKMVIPPALAVVPDAAFASPPMMGMEGARHPGQAAFDRLIGVHLGDRWGSRILCGGTVRVSVLAAGARGALINALIVREDSRGRGFARAALEALCAAADEARIPLTIHAMPFEARVDVRRLMSFYATLGFVDEGPQTMRRMPRQMEAAE